MRNWPPWALGLTSLLLASLVGLVLACVSLVGTAERVIKELPVQLGSIVERQSNEMQATAAGESKAWRGMVERQSNDARMDARSESKSWRDGTTEEIREMRKEMIHMADARLSELIAKADAPSAAAVELLDEYRRVPSIVGARLDPWTDCKGNGACWQAQMTAALGAGRVTLGETSRTMRSIREATPGITKNIDRTTANIERMTRPDSLAMKVLKLAAPIAGGALFGAIK